mmetsp:Transcript_20927/g.67328  ORF Transcript_20927/g.67328 Transcript_20927/m.67328 type:complete len:120 (-) Transcript_20927:1303-1662(-)
MVDYLSMPGVVLFDDESALATLLREADLLEQSRLMRLGFAERKERAVRQWSDHLQRLIGVSPTMAKQCRPVPSGCGLPETLNELYGTNYSADWVHSWPEVACEQFAPVTKSAFSADSSR